jgi:GT2 family glycosyltransferase
MRTPVAGSTGLFPPLSPERPLRYDSRAMEDQETQPVPSLKTSVLIVSYNSEPALRRCLEALALSEQPELFETLVVDCGSMDGSPQVDEDFPKVTVLRLPRNFGRTKARNIGIRTAKGEFLFLLDPVVLVQPSTIASLTAKLDADKDAVGLSPLLVNADGEPMSRCGELPAPADLYRAWCDDTPWYEIGPVAGTSSDELIDFECPDPRALLVRTHAVKAMNYFDERYGEFGSDVDLYTHAYKASKRLSLVPAARVECRGTEGVWQPDDPGAKQALTADFAVGAIAYTGKHYGWWPALRLRLKMSLRALGQFQLGLLSQILNSQKVDGSQQSL